MSTEKTKKIKKIQKNYFKCCFCIEKATFIEIKNYTNNIKPEIIASVINTESSFNENAVSFKGAIGLMQLLPSTAKWLCEKQNIEYSSSYLTNPNFNINVGTCYLKYLIDKFENINTAIVAYNAGEGRIADCRSFAESQNADKNSWDTIVSLIPQMRDDSILEDESVKLGKFQGYETITYVKNIMDLYDAFCTICPSI